MKTRERRWSITPVSARAILWLLLVCAASAAPVEDGTQDTTDTPTQTVPVKDDAALPVKDSRGLFAPRMDYEQWKPLGRGDPLKNDPTYDYVPPVLDQVHYWIDPASRKPDAPHPADMKKTEILILGVSSKKPSSSFSTMADTRRDTYDPFLKFVEGPNFNSQNNYQRIHRPQYAGSQTYYSSSFYKNKPEHKEPYTILVPPPVPTHHLPEPVDYQQTLVSSTSTTTPVAPTLPATSSSSSSSIAVEEANLVYQSSSISTPDEWKGSNTYATIAESSSQVTWRTPLPDALNNTQKTMQQLPTMRAPEIFKEASSFSMAPSMNVLLKPMLKLPNTKNMETGIIVAPSEITMHKGQVTDDTLDLSSTYVSIGKPDAQVQPATGMAVDVIPMSKPLMSSSGITIKHTPMLINSPLMSSVLSPVITSVGSHSVFRKPHPSPMKKLEMMPMTLQTMQTMQTMQPPAPTQNNHLHHKKPSPFLHGLLKKEVTPVYTTTTTTPLPTTTSVSSLTTDPLFKHYKQPVEPLRGPMYLIIQGHSKVKTYGPSKQINGISVQETNEILTSDDRHTEYPVKHLHELMKENRAEWDREKRDSRSGRLQTLKHIVETGLGSIDVKSDEIATRRNDEDVKETELVVKYDVSSDEEETSEVYHKGIVESEVAPSRSQHFN